MQKNEFQNKIAEVSKTIFSYCMAKTPTREEAEDLSQDILHELIKSVKNIRDDKAFYAFMWSVAGNVYKQWYRKKLKNKTCDLLESIPLNYDLTEDYTDDIYLLRRELALLSEKYRKATILYYVDGHSCSEISSELAISESMVKYLLFKSRKILKEGMNMERNLGELSYNPKKLFPMYYGEGPNCFWEFMQSKIRQNIVSACYNDSLNVQQLSIETGIPLPYLDDEIKALEEKRIITRDGNYYKANIIVITSECTNEIEQAMTKYHKVCADKIETFLKETIEEYKEIGFIGSDFSENTLRWQLLSIVFKRLHELNCEIPDVPKTYWGEKAFTWCIEKFPEKFLFNYCEVESRYSDYLCFQDYFRSENHKGDHHDFYGNERYINIFCDICRDEKITFSEYDLDAVAEMIKKGYVIKTKDSYRATVPIYTTKQFKIIKNLVDNFISRELNKIIKEMDIISVKILSAHTPKHLQNQIKGIASTDKFINVISIPVTLLIEREVIKTKWHPFEMPSTYVVLNK